MVPGKHSDAELGGAGIPRVALSRPQQQSANASPSIGITNYQVGNNRVLSGWLIEAFERYANEYHCQACDLACSLGEQYDAPVLAAPSVHLPHVFIGDFLARAKT